MKRILALIYVAILLISVSTTYALADEVSANNVAHLVYTESKVDSVMLEKYVETYKGEKVNEVPLNLECSLNVNGNKTLSYHVSEHDVRHFDRCFDVGKNEVETIETYKDLPLLVPLT
jgi:hypothetical protein